MKERWSKKTNTMMKALFAALLLATGVLFLYALFHGGIAGEAYTGSFAVSELSDHWTLYAADGKMVKNVTLPMDAYQHAGERVILRRALPADVREGMRLCIRAQRQDVTIRINGEERSSYRLENFQYRRATLVSAYLLADLHDDDAHGELEIEIVPQQTEAGRYHAVTYAYGNNVWFPIIQESLPLFLIAILLIVAGLLSITAYFLLREKVAGAKAVVYLAETLIVTGMWMLSESRIRQLLFRSPSYSNVFSFLLIESVSAFLLMYVDEIQNHRYEKIYTVLELCILGQVLLNGILNITHAADFYNTLGYSHIWSGAAILCLLVTLSLDIARGKLKEYPYTATGLLILLFSGIFELVNFYISSQFGFGVFLGAGLLLVLCTTVLQTVSNELRRLEQVRLANSASRAKSNFLANMSHEIRTPINAILGMDEMILRESGEGQIRSYAGDIRDAGKTLLSLINDILDFSKVEEGRMEILPAQYDLSSVINDLVSMTRGRAENKGLRFNVQVDETTPHLLVGDELRIRQCALNLLTNAVKYTEKGDVTLSVGYEKLSSDRISLRICVTDTGIGMKKESMNKLFTPFARIEEVRNRYIEGTGLGMSITRQLLTLMGGKLEVDSVYGEGSTFSFALEQPVVKWVPVGKFTGHYEVKAAHSAYRERVHAPDAHLLVIDDTPLNLAVVKGLLKKTDICIDTAESGPEAIKLAAKRRYDIIFIDHMMPGMDGIETLRELKKLPNAEGTVYVALTANALSGSRERYLEAGFTDYLSKPVDGERLEEMLTTYLPDEVLLEAEEREEAPAPSERASILVADDDARSLRLAVEILGKGFLVKTCTNGGEMLREADRLQPELILLNMDLGGESGFTLLRALREQPSTAEIPVVFLADADNEESEIAGFRSGAADYIRKPFVPEALLQRTRRIIALHRLQRGLQSEVSRQTQRAERLTREMMLALSKTVDAKDHYTKGHSERVAAYAAELARRMGKSRQEQETIYETGLMHDIGKVGVPEALINKTEPLTEEEFEKLRRHTVLGGEILSLITEMPELAAGARSHHERWDGTGYPDALSGAGIPEAARIICVADSYDAMTSTRIYADVRPQAAVRAEIERCAGTQFDPRVAEAMLAMIDDDTDYRMTEQTADIRVWKGSDRLWEEAAGAASPAPKRRAEAEPPAIPDWLWEIGALNAATGLRYCGTEETWLGTLRIYARSVPANAAEIEELWNAGDVAGTTVKVHALKSTSRAIGAETLGAFAERLEFAGKANDTQTLEAELGALLEDYRALGRQLAPLCGEADGEDLPPLSPEEVREAYDAIREVLSSMDYDSIEFLADHLRKHRVPDGERELCAAICSAADDFDWEKIGELLKRSEEAES